MSTVHQDYKKESDIEDHFALEIVLWPLPPKNTPVLRGLHARAFRTKIKDAGKDVAGGGVSGGDGQGGNTGEGEDGKPGRR